MARKVADANTLTAEQAQRLLTGHKLTNLPGMSSMGTYIDAARIGDEARASTPEWLSNLTRKS
jgi:hypothetical protein